MNTTIVKIEWSEANEGYMYDVYESEEQLQNEYTFEEDGTMRNS